MASSMISSAAMASVSRVSPAQNSMVAPFTGLKSSSAFPVTQKANKDITSLANNGGRIQCFLVLKELEEAKKEYPNAFIRIIGFDNVRQVQCISFIAYKPPSFEDSNA
ncbi:hypothetical protein L6164_026866 [Bauhinia variegata]|uniref:Uncharacterized protein n=1 Tax=Bauhinia variegata TaxID=167791 RepID=A0ACB9LSZ9_BAUVA|nr:hypothetical protein L6164_026866 [Bauhinia variegata]